MEHKHIIDNLLSHLPIAIRSPLERARAVYEIEVTELTFRADRPVCIYTALKRYYITKNGALIDAAGGNDLLKTSRAELHEIFLSLCDYSVYAHQDELAKGYITLGCGARVGVCGTAVTRGGEVVNIKFITTLSFRVPREDVGCSGELLRLIDPLRGALICGAPSSGKTTLIRDMARELSYRYRVSVIDERGELSAASAGGGFDLGLSDISVNMPKGAAIINSLRSLAPDIIICDELGDERDVVSVGYALRCGAAFIATVHAASIDDLRTRAVTRELLTAGAFRYIVFLSGRREPGRVSRVYEWSDADA